MAVEVEARFRADSVETLSDLRSRETVGPAVLGPPHTVEEVDRYLDTDDGRLADARWACRLRSREGVTRISLKGPPEGQADGWHHRRPELEGPATDRIEPERWPSSAALDLLNALSGGRTLRERIRLDQERTERRVVLPSGAALGLLTLDRVRMTHGADDLGQLLIVELELDGSSADAEPHLHALAAGLAAVPGLVPEPRSKLEHALTRLAERA